MSHSSVMLIVPMVVALLASGDGNGRIAMAASPPAPADSQFPDEEARNRAYLLSSLTNPWLTSSPRRRLLRAIAEGVPAEDIWERLVGKRGELDELLPPLARRGGVKLLPSLYRKLGKAPDLLGKLPYACILAGEPDAIARTALREVIAETPESSPNWLALKLYEAGTLPKREAEAILTSIQPRLLATARTYPALYVAAAAQDSTCLWIAPHLRKRWSEILEAQKERRLVSGEEYGLMAAFGYVAAHKAISREDELLLQSVSQSFHTDNIATFDPFYAFLSWLNGGRRRESADDFLGRLGDRNARYPPEYKWIWHELMADFYCDRNDIPTFAACATATESPMAVRIAAMRMLWFIAAEDPQVHAVMIQLLDHRKSEVRRHAAWGICQCVEGPRQRGVLATAVRKRLACEKSDQVISALEDVLDHEGEP